LSGGAHPPSSREVSLRGTSPAVGLKNSSSHFVAEPTHPPPQRPRGTGSDPRRRSWWTRHWGDWGDGCAVWGWMSRPRRRGGSWVQWLPLKRTPNALSSLQHPSRYSLPDHQGKFRVRPVSVKDAHSHTVVVSTKGAEVQKRYEGGPTVHDLIFTASLFGTRAGADHPHARSPAVRTTGVPRGILR
jgi:hypothetical protein